MPKPSSKASSQYLDVQLTPWDRRLEDGTILGQTPVLASLARFRVVMAGRQSGKTLTGIYEICQVAMGNPKQICWWVSPNYRVKDRAWRGLKDHLPKGIIVSESEAQLRLQLGNGSWIFVKSADAPDSLVSEGLNFVVCDEAGQWAETAWTRGIRPMLTVTRGRALFLGTPRGRNWFHRLWLLGGKDPEYESFHWKTADSPYADPEELIEAERNMPRDLFKQEFEADPHDNAQAVFRNHRDCVGPMGEPDGRSCIGVDLARKIDYTALVGVNSQRQVFHVERYQVDWAQQRQRISARVMGFAPYIPFLEVDATGVGDAFIPSLREAGMQVEPYQISSNQQKTALIDNLRVAFEQNAITIPDDPDLLNELDTFEFQTTEKDDTKRSVERYQYGAPPGGHDDLVVALALAAWGQRGIPVYAAQGAGGPMNNNYLNRRRGRGTGYMN